MLCQMFQKTEQSKKDVSMRLVAILVLNSHKMKDFEWPEYHRAKVRFLNSQKDYGQCLQVTYSQACKIELREGFILLQYAMK